DRTEDRTNRPTALGSARVVVVGGLLGEVVAELLEEVLAPGLDVVVLELGQLAEEFFLAGGQPGGGLDDDLDQFVAAAPAVDIRHAAALELQDLAGLRAAGDGQAVGTVERGDLDLGAQRGLGEADGDAGDQIAAGAFEERVLADV